MKKCRCGAEMVQLETENNVIKTYVCPKCRVLDNYFEKGPLEALLEKAVKVGENGRA